MNPIQLSRFGIDPALCLLPAKMDTPEARKILIAIAFQESAIHYRKQVRGPARGFYQFEQIGIDGVEKHPATGNFATEIRLALSVDKQDVYRAIEFNDILASAYARLLLWRHPKPIPTDMEGAWSYYLDLWRPGKPHHDRWKRSWMVG